MLSWSDALKVKFVLGCFGAVIDTKNKEKSYEIVSNVGYAILLIGDVILLIPSIISWN